MFFIWFSLIIFSKQTHVCYIKKKFREKKVEQNCSSENVNKQTNVKYLIKIHKKSIFSLPKIACCDFIQPNAIAVKQMHYNIKSLFFVLFGIFKYLRGSISPTFLRTFFARIFHNNVLFLVTFFENAREKRWWNRPLQSILPNILQADYSSFDKKNRQIVKRGKGTTESSFVPNFGKFLKNHLAANFKRFMG